MSNHANISEIDKLTEYLTDKYRAYLTPAEVAEELSMKESTLNNWRSRKEHLEYTHFGSGINAPVRYSARSVAEFMLKNTQKIKAKPND